MFGFVALAAGMSAAFGVGIGIRCFLAISRAFLAWADKVTLRRDRLANSKLTSIGTCLLHDTAPKDRETEADVNLAIRAVSKDLGILVLDEGSVLLHVPDAWILPARCRRLIGDLVTALGTKLGIGRVVSAKGLPHVWPMPAGVPGCSIH